MNNSKAKRLFTLWIIAFVLFCMFTSVWATSFAYENQLEAKDLPKAEKLIFSCVLLLGFCPSLIVVHNHARKEDNRKIQRKTIYLCFVICIAALGTIITILFS